MTLTCTVCHNRTLHAKVVRTDLTPSGVEFGVCENCDRTKCGACRTPAGPTDKRCRSCGVAIHFAP